MLVGSIFSFSNVPKVAAGTKEESSSSMPMSPWALGTSREAVDCSTEIKSSKMKLGRVRETVLALLAA
jgi:hypothetical protein